MPVQRRQLAAIMFTDIVGYTALMGKDEEKAFQLLEKNRKLHLPLIEKYNGTFLKEIGDAIMASFTSAGDAVLCSMDIIRATKKESYLSIRIGIHGGDVVFKDNDVYGDGVNIASRIQELAIPDSVLISGKIYEEIKNRKHIHARFLGTFHFKNDSKSREIYAISNPGLKVPKPGDLIVPAIQEKPSNNEKQDAKTDNKKPTTKLFNINSPRAGLLFIFTIMALVFGSLLLINFQQKTKVKWARQEAIIEIERLIDLEEYNKAYHLAIEAEQYIPDDSLLIRQFQRMSGYGNIYSDPPGANLYRKPVGSPVSEYEFIGQTPIESTRSYIGFSNWKFEKEGFNSMEFLSQAFWLHNDTIKLFKTGTIPGNMVFVPFDNWSFEPTGWISGLGYRNYPPPPLKDFLIDKYEVRNKDYMEFVDAGGYKIRKYWQHPFIQNGKEIMWEEALNQFRDKTGQVGPATWEIGSYPDGQADYPVAGISWYEAMAYAEYMGKSLPTIYHWIYAATPLNSYLISPFSNFNGTGSVSVGSNEVPGVYGTYDMAGNVREWCLNTVSDTGNPFILGGGWSDNPYAYNIAFAQDAFDRSSINGIRCVKNIEDIENQKYLFASVELDRRKFLNEKPVSDQMFEIYLHQFHYDKTPFNEVIKSVNSKQDNILCQKIIIDAAYGDERLPLFLFLPKNVKPPFQTVIYFPTTWPFELRNFESGPTDAGVIEHFVKSGRAAIYPIYKGTYERNTGFGLVDLERNLYKEHVIMWGKDLSRTIDYLETRDDFNISKIAYFGYSLGAANGAILPAIDKRIKLVMLHVGGLWQENIMSEVDQINYLPRITVPVLMLNGRYDHIFPLETAQKPMFELFGTDEKHKRHYIYERGHRVPWHELTKETLTWMDKYFGPVDNITSNLEQ
jgi:predicted esterase